MSRKSSNVGAAMLQPGRQSQAAGNISVMPAAEMPMVLTLDQLSPNPDNPRTSRNPRYDDIKTSIRSRGLDTVPKVTRDPDGEPDMYIFSDGGNTRYQILSELWHETGEDRFFRVHVLFKPWPGRLQCVIGHLAENEVRGELSFIEKAQGIHKARSIYEEQMGKTVSLRQLSELLTHEGLPVHYSTVSRMEDALKYLYPWIPDLLESGLGRPQITALLALRHDAERVWDEFCLISDTGDKSFSDVFGQCCGRFNSPELWSLEMFRDEFIGDLLQASPGTTVTRNVQPVSPDEYARTPEVVRYDRYLLVSTDPQAAQRDPLSQIIDIRIPSSLHPTVADALRYALRQSGYSLCATGSANGVLYRQALPAVQYQLGPMRLRTALQVMAGPAWQLEVDDVQRVVCHILRDGYQLPVSQLPPPVSTWSTPAPSAVSQPAIRTPQSVPVKPVSGGFLRK